MQFLHHAIEKNDIGKLKELLNNKETDINQLDDYGYSALHIASRKGFMEIAMLLVESGIDVNAKDKNGQTILHYVAVYNQLELARLIQ
jgi:ankyrin repeat protein